MKRVIIFLIVPFIFILHCQATEPGDDIMNEIRNELNDFKSALPKEIIDFLPSEIWNGEFNKIINDSFNEASLLELILDYLFLGLNSASKSFGAILIIIILCSIFNTLSEAFKSNAVKSSFTIASSLCISITVFNLCTSLASTVSNYLIALCNIMESFAPLMATLYIITGNITSGGIANASFVLFISIIENFLVIFMLPIVNICICLTIIKSFSKQYDFSGISKTLKNTFTGVTVFVMSIFMFVLSCKNIISQASDSLSIKTAKFAISSFIPIVGSTVNDALRTITSSLSIIKNSCGIIAIIAIALIMLPVIISLLLNKLLYSISSSIAKALGCNNEYSVLDEASSICGFLLALVLCTCILFIFALTILIKTSVVI